MSETICVPFVDLAALDAGMVSEIEQAMRGVVERADFILGHDVESFEEEFADYCEVKHATGVDSGTSALELALRAYDIGPGDEVITVANTFIATAIAISCTGAKPVLVDADSATSNIDVSQIEQAISPQTKAIIPVHLYGQPADMDPILDLAHRRGLVVIEDACQAHGARYKGRRVGSLGNAAAFSFYPAKNLGAYGDGGAITTNDDRVADAVQLIRNYGQREKYHHERLGLNRRLDTLQAAVLRVKLRYLDALNDARRKHAMLYSQLLDGHRVETPDVPDYAEPVWHLYVIRTAIRSELKSQLDRQGIATGIHYPVPIHLQPAYRALGCEPGLYPVTERLAGRILSLPMFPELDGKLVCHVATLINQITSASPAPTVH